MAVNMALEHWLLLPGVQSVFILVVILDREERDKEEFKIGLPLPLCAINGQ